MYKLKRIGRPAALLVVVCLMVLPGCGTNFDEVLYQTVSASGQISLDLLLTDFANRLADAFDQDGTPPPDDGPDGDTPPTDGPPPDDGPPIDELTGDPDFGEELFVANNCAACHCADAAGGCALSAPSLVGVATATLDDRLRGEVEHPGGKFILTNQEIADLQAYLASLATGNG